MPYTVVAPMVYLRLRQDDGSLISRDFYAGAPVPPNVDPDNLRHHLDSSLVAEYGSPEHAVGAPAGTPLPGYPPNVAVQPGMGAGQPVPPFSESLLSAVEGMEPSQVDGAEYDDVAEPEVGDPVHPVNAAEFDDVAQGGAKLPRKNAAEPAWRDYHVAQLMAHGESVDAARAEADGMSRDELIAHYK